jgi:precorrin-3B C17-methyltransferase
MNGRIYLVGVGPGSRENITPRAAKVLKHVQVIIGQKVCLDLLWKLVIGKEVIADEMTPIERSAVAVEKAWQGRDVAVVSSGDIGIYAFASTFFSYLRDKGLTLKVEVIPGVTVASAAAALLGSPLGRDFATISLTDQATEWNDIKKRIISATESDFVVVLYNPRGKVGSKRVIEAIKILLSNRQIATPVGIVTSATTRQEKVLITTLGEVLVSEIETDTIVIVGSSQTYIYNGRMVTPRDYIKGVGY